MFVDSLGREHCGRAGDYLVESSDGVRRIAPREIFEDVYVAMGSTTKSLPRLTHREAQVSPPSTFPAVNRVS